ncbi:MAG TPA: STT3 domain-containing protein, partial [Candidatus Lokiarchaeia archaeon]|nr:STT3 domain-containing protein [Candidatus Lokiarchaeia archaeon]
MFILFLGLLIRIAPIFRAPPMIKEFDPWSQYRAIIYILQNGSSAYWSWHDTMSWYPEGTTLWVMRPVLIFAVVYAYQFLTLIGISTTPFLVDFYMPAVIGTLDILVVFLIGKELLDSRAGLLAAFFTAFDPGILQRTTAGFADTETFGILAVLLWFLFYIKAMKTGKMPHATMAGLSMIMLELSWGGSDLCQLLVPLLAVIFMLSDRFNDNVFMTSVVCTGCGLIAQVLNPENAGSPFAQSVSGLMSGITFYLPLACFFLYFIYHWFYKQKTQRPKLYEGVWNIIKWGAIPAVAVFAILFWGFPNVIPVNIQGRLESILNPFLRGSMAAVSSVGEQMPAAWSVFYYNIIIPIFLIPVGVYFAMKRMQHADIALVAAVLITYFTTGSMIRIVVIFAPFAAIIGAFGLASVLNYFGNIGRKQVVISRRRKRQAKQTMGPADAAIVFVFVGVLMIAQVVQSVNIEVQQMSYSELVVGGQYQDWPEALAWMRQNLQPTSVVVSWWDYGDWTTVIGNVTSVNDNHTDNNTRMGTTGLAMMQPDEIESAKVFRFLHADYAMVYFGHLISGLGGDEGKWPWMLRIANEVTGDLESYGLRVSTGEGAWQADEPFDESQYYNSTSGLYSQKWFDSMLVKMMFYGEPTTVSEAQDQLGAYFAEQVSGYAGDSQTAAVQARTTADGRTWAQVIPDHGNYQFTCFNLAFESSNHLVKIFKLDYTALDTHVNATAPAVYSNGLGNVQVANTGLYPVTLGNVTIASESPTATPITASMPINANETSTGLQTLNPGASSTVWFNSSQPLYTGRGATVSVSATGTGQFGQTFTVSGQAPQILVTDMPTPQIAIDRSSSSWWLAGIPGGYSNVMNITVQNVGPIPVKLNTITSDIYGSNAPSTPSQVSTETGSFLVLPGQSTQAFLQLPVGPAPEIPNTVTVTTIEGAEDTVLMSNSTYGGYRLSILPEAYTALPEGVAQGTIPIDKDYIPVTLGQSTAWGNQTVTFAVKNTGSYRLGLQDVYVTNGVWDPNIPPNQQTPQTVDGSSLWLNPGDTRILQQTI